MLGIAEITARNVAKALQPIDRGSTSSTSGSPGLRPH